MRHINVWVRSGLSTRLRQLLAEQHDNTTHKPFTPTEAAGLYRELKVLIAEDAARRQRATRFGAESDVMAGGAGGAESAQPSERVRSRSQASWLVTGRSSYTMLEQVSELQRLAADSATPHAVREAAAVALAGIEAYGKVHPHYQQYRQAHDAHRRTRRAAANTDHIPPRSYGVRAFVLTWGDLSGWAAHYDPGEIGMALNELQWAGFEATVAATVAFADAARAARAARAGRAA